MTWTYTGAPDTTSDAGRRDGVRLLTRDTNPSSQLLSDEEIAFLLAQNGDHVWRAAADACEQISARQAQSMSVGDLSISDLGINWMDLAGRYRRRANSRVAPYAGGISQSDMATFEADTDRVVPAFTRDLHRDPET